MQEWADEGEADEGEATGLMATPEHDPDAQRADIRAWLAANPDPTPRQLADAGLVAPHWPEPWGLGADAALQVAVAEELAAADVTTPDNAIAIGWAGPTIVAGQLVGEVTQSRIAHFEPRRPAELR